jgi:hypothetical protein
VKNLDGLYIRVFAPAARFALGQRKTSCPFGVAAGRDAPGPEVARGVRGEMDHETVRINVARVAALMHPPVTINDLELEQEDSVMKWPVTQSRWPTLPAKLRRVR